MQSRIAFLLVHLFPMYVVMLATDALRLANKHAGTRVFDWLMVSESGKPVQASNGMWMECDTGLSDAADLNYVFVVAGDDQPRKPGRLLKDWLIQAQRNPTMQLGAIDSGVFLLAASRLVQKRAVTVHPDSLNAFREQFPEISTVADAVVESDGLITCAGGLAVAPLMLTLIERACGVAVATAVARDLVAHEGGVARHSGAASTLPPSAVVEAVIRKMKAALDTPVDLDALAREARMSTRGLSRLFRDQFGCGPVTYYRKLRLGSAKQLVLQSDMTVSDIAIATGFQSVSAFSRAFSEEFGQSPRAILSRVRREGNASTVPAANGKKRLGTAREK